MLVKDQHFPFVGFQYLTHYKMQRQCLDEQWMGSALKGQDLCSSEFNSRIGMHEIKVPEYIVLTASTNIQSNWRKIDAHLELRKMVLNYSDNDNDFSLSI